MIRRALICVVLQLWAGIASAQEIRVQSGDHDGFTRLVAAIGANRDWQVARDGRRVRISFDPAAPGFDLSTVFTLITRDRLASISWEDGLVLDLACDCTVEVSRYQNRYAVIDITDTPYQPPSPEPQASLDLPMTAPASAQTPPPALLAQVEQEPAPPTQRPTFDLEEAAAIMAEQLARAAAAGLLDAAPSEPFSSADPITLDEPTQDPHPSEQRHSRDAGGDHADHHPTPTDPHPEPTPQETPPIVAANAFDLNQGSWPDRLIASAPTHCLAPPARAIADWPGELSFLNALGGLRAQLYDDRGELQQAVSLELAELYLVYGFGAEALFWLRESGNPPGFHLALAQFLEFGADAQFGSFSEYELCPEALTLWLFLTDQERARPSEEARQVILSQFYELPTPLRDLVGPPLALAFVSTDATGAALEIREALIRGGRVSQQELAFLDANLPGVPAPAASALDPSNAGSIRANQALALRLRSQIQTHGSAEEADLVAADALIRETTPPLEMNGLRHIAALGHALSGDVDAALLHLDLHGQRDAEAIRPVFANILTELMEQGRSAPLLLLLSSDEFGQFGYFPNPAFRRRVARYLLDHGLPEMARDLILAGGSDHARDRELLSLAFDRLAHDRSIEQTESPHTHPEIADIPVAETPAAVASLLDDSRNLRQQALALLDEDEVNNPVEISH